MRTLNNSLARQLTKDKSPDIELADVVAVGKGTVDVKTSTGSIYRHVPIAGGANVGDSIRLQFIRNKPLAFGGNGSNNVSGGNSGGSSITYSGGSLSAHALNGPYHTGTLDATQAPWAFAVDGSRAMTGSITLGAGLTVDGIDVSVFGGRQVLSAGVGLSGGGVLYSGDVTITLTSSSNPGATQKILASDASGLLQLVGLGIGMTPTSGEIDIAGKLKLLSTVNLITLAYDGSNQWTFNTGSTGNLTLTPSITNADLIVVGDIGIGGSIPVGQTEQLRVAYDSNYYLSVDIANNGAITFTGVASTATNAHMRFVSANKFAFNMLTAPVARVEIRDTTSDQLRVSFSGTEYLNFSVIGGGNTSLVTAGSTAHLFLNPVGKVGIGMSTSPAAKLEIRDNNAQLQLAYDGTNYSSFATGSGGNLTVTTYGSDMVLDLQPSGGIAGTKTLRPANGYDANLGSLTKKWLAIHAAELWVENLVAYDTTAIMGGRWNISNASILTADWPSVSSGPATIAFRAADSASIASGVTSWVINKPTGSLQDDILILVMSMQDAATITPASGFTLISGPTDWQGTRRVAFYYKVLGSGEPSTYTFTTSVATAGTWGTVTFSGVDTATPINVTGTFQFNSTGSTSMTALAVSPTVTNTMLVMLGVANSNGSMTPAGGMTERVDIVNASAFNISFIANEALTSTGTTGNRVATISTSSQSVTGLIALKPGTVGGSGNTVTLKHNSFSVGDIGRLEANGRVEWVQVTAGPTGTGPYSYTFTRNLDGTGSNDWVAGDAIVNTGQAGTGWLDVYSMWSSKGTPIEYIYNFKSSAFSANLSQSTAFNLFGASIASGDIIYYGMGGGMWSNINHYITSITGSGFTGVLEYWNGSAWTTVSGYTTTIYLASTGATTSLTAGALPASGQTGTYVHAFSASQSGWAKTTINSVNAYWIRHRCTANTSVVAANGYKRTIRGSAQYGPTMVGWIRNSTTFNDFSERFAVGNLHGLYDYGKVTYGFVAGRYSQVWVATDDTSGFRVMGGNVMLGNWDITGQITVGVNANSRARVVITPTGRVSIWQNDSGGGSTERFYVDASGNMRLVGNGSNYLDVNGSTGVATFSGVINVVGGSMSGVGITGGTISGGTITGSDITSSILGGNVNQMYNSSFETDSDNDGIPDGWGLYNNNSGSSVTSSLQASGGVDNGKFFRVTLTATNNGTKGIFSNTSTNRTGVKLNTYYVVSWFAKAGGPGSGGSIGRQMVLFWNFTPTVTTLLNPNLSTNWQRYAFKIIWPSGTLDPNIFISVTTGSYASGSIIDIDHVQLEEGEYVNPYKPSVADVVDVAGKVVLPVAPVGAGLFLTSTYMGYYSGSQWQTYMDNAGNFMLRGAPTANIGAISFNPSTAKLSGGYYAGSSYASYKEQWYTDGLTGAISAGAGTVVLNLDGIEISDNNGIVFSGNGIGYGKVSTFYDPTGPFNAVGIKMERVNLGSYLFGPNSTSFYSDSVGYTGNYSGGAAVYSSTVTASGASASTRYVVSFQYKATGNWAGTLTGIAQLEYTFLNSSNTIIGGGAITFASTANQSISNWTQVEIPITTVASTAKISLDIIQTNTGGGTNTGTFTISIRRTKVRSELSYSSLTAAEAGVVIGDHLLFSDVWSSFPDGAGITHRSEIANDTGSYKALMIVGNKSAGGNRRVAMWDRVTVNGEFIVTGSLLDQNQLAAWTNLTSYTTNWADYGSPWRGVQYKKFGDMVFLTGLAGRSSTTSTSGGNIFTGIPTAIRPQTNKDVLIHVLTSVGSVRADITSAGNIVLFAAVPASGWVSFSGISYTVAS